MIENAAPAKAKTCTKAKSGKGCCAGKKKAKEM